MDEQPPYIPGAPPQMGPTMQQLGQATSEPKKRRKQRASSASEPKSPSRRKASRPPPRSQAPTPRRVIKRKVSAPYLRPQTASAAVSPATTTKPTSLGAAIGHAAAVLSKIPPSWHGDVLDALDALFRK